MKYAKNNTDLLILPETRTERISLLNFCQDKMISPQLCISDVEGQDWYAQPFYEISDGIDLLGKFLNSLGGDYQV